MMALQRLWPHSGANDQDQGLISMLAFDDGGNCYFVKTAKDSNWFKEAQLIKAD